MENNTKQQLENIVEPLEALNKKELTRLVNTWADRAKFLNLKFPSQKYKEQQASFCSGFMIGLSKTHGGITICIQSGRDIVEEFNKYLK